MTQPHSYTGTPEPQDFKNVRHICHVHILQSEQAHSPVSLRHDRATCPVILHRVPACNMSVTCSNPAGLLQTKKVQHEHSSKSRRLRALLFFLGLSPCTLDCPVKGFRHGTHVPQGLALPALLAPPVLDLNARLERLMGCCLGAATDEAIRGGSHREEMQSLSLDLLVNKTTLTDLMHKRTAILMALV